MPFIGMPANNKGSLHPLCFFCQSQLQFSICTFIMTTVCDSFPVKLRCHSPTWPLPLSKKKQYQNTELGGQQSQTGNTGMPVPDNKRVKRRMVEILLPAVDLVGSLSWIPELSGGALRAGRMAGCVVGVCPVSVSPGRGSEAGGLFDNAAFLTP